MKHITITLTAALVFIYVIVVQTSCANIIPPTGGPRDSLPPVLISAEPKDSALKFTGNKILLTFDEYVQLDDRLSEFMIVSPNPDQPPLVTNKLRTVTVKLKDSLKPNTTYAINFGNGIKDVNEANIFKNFTYVFSTGDSIAKGTFSGKVLLAETGDADSTLIVLLHSNLNDSSIKKNKADYYTRLDSGGNFNFKYLPYGKFAVYVLPNDYTKKYDDSTKMFAFANEPVDISNATQRVQLFAYNQYKATEKPRTSASTQGSKKAEDKFIRVNTNIMNNELDILGSLQLTTSKRIKIFDSLKITLTDTSYNLIKNYTLKFESSKTSIDIYYQWPPDSLYKLIIQKDALADSMGAELAKADTISYRTRAEREYGSIRLHFNNLDLSRNPVLQLVQSNAIVKSVPLAQVEWYQRLIMPGEYQLRLLFDDNKNDVWDAGDFDKKQQPELVQKINRKLTIKANIDSEVDINL